MNEEKLLERVVKVTIEHSLAFVTYSTLIKVQRPSHFDNLVKIQQC